MSNNNIVKDIEESRRRTDKQVKQFVQIPLEIEATNQVTVLKESIARLKTPALVPSPPPPPGPPQTLKKNATIFMSMAVVPQPDHLTNSRTKKIATKRNIQDLSEDELILKQNYIRGGWSPPRTFKTTPPTPPNGLCEGILAPRSQCRS
ncbi:hypothetical protein EDC94DRAFT_696731 [Helicostylum pulchrum]|nr:hypothetical protein EDC94DRAFT_696731 [Helicostylum pulchrum]